MKRKSTSTLFVSLTVLTMCCQSLAAQPAAAGQDHQFQVVLLVADNRGQSMPQDLPQGAQQALADARNILPYKSYRVSDMVSYRTTDHSQTRMKGPAGQTYTLGIRAREGEAGPGSLMVSFDLIEVDKSQQGSRTPRAATSLISTSFGIEEGETVVVGASRLAGRDEALVALLTVLPE